jgi:hypothetical protein
MKRLNLLLTGIFACCLNLVSLAQYEYVLPEYKLETKEDYAKYEQDMVKCADWLEANPVKTEDLKRAQINVFVLKWLEGSPSVTINVDKKLFDLLGENHHLLSMFFAGYARYVLQNNFSKDSTKANTAAMKSVINLFNLGGVKKNKHLQKAIAADKDGSLEVWVKNYFEKK